ncbi:IS110 family transposase [Aquisalimonas sp. APHAB1-3]|uniref:IS110 family transposase n=1 Tax=Aquisalimonas sp. APHAB1-3 TaxID=3402080 RepID=UPI003AAD1A14
MTIAVDLAKTVFEIAVSDGNGKIIERQRLSRSQFQCFFQNREVATVVMEACGTAHFWGRKLARQGFTVRLLPAQYVRPYRRRNKTDRADAEALLEAARCGEILDVAVKTEHQQAIQGLHRIRSQWMAARTARINALRALLREQGIELPRGAGNAVKAAPQAIDDERVPYALRIALLDVVGDILSLEARIERTEQQLDAFARSNSAAQTLMAIPGVGLLSATALVAAVGSPHQFSNGRHLAAWLGLTPRENSSGMRRRLGRISKRGDPYLRTLLTHGARAVLSRAKQLAAQGKPLNHLQAWALALEQRTNHNKATCALANKLARICWAVWIHQRPFNGNYQPHAVAA